jgi:hypothetical protein
MNSEAPGGWAQVNNLASIGQAELQDLTSNRVYEVNVPFASFSLSPTSTYYELNVAINGDWGSGDVTVYVDNIRVTSGP